MSAGGRYLLGSLGAVSRQNALSLQRLQLPDAKEACVSRYPGTRERTCVLFGSNLETVWSTRHGPRVLHHCRLIFCLFWSLRRKEPNDCIGGPSQICRELYARR
jgi:hypothetical protein